MIETINSIKEYEKNCINDTPIFRNIDFTEDSHKFVLSPFALKDFDSMVEKLNYRFVKKIPLQEFAGYYVEIEKNKVESNG